MAGLLSRMTAAAGRSNNLHLISLKPRIQIYLRLKTEDQPLDLSHKGSSPSVSPNSATADHPPLTSALNLSSGSTSAAAAAAAAAAVALNNPTGLNPLFPGMLNSSDIYRFQDTESEDEGHFPCTKCEKTFSKKSSFTRHLLEHTGK